MFCNMCETLKQKIQLLIGDKGAYKNGASHLKVKVLRIL